MGNFYRLGIVKRVAVVSDVLPRWNRSIPFLIPEVHMELNGEGSGSSFFVVSIPTKWHIVA